MLLEIAEAEKPFAVLGLGEDQLYVVTVFGGEDCLLDIVEHIELQVVG